MNVRYGSRIYQVVGKKEMAGITMIGIEDEPGHIDYLNPDSVEFLDDSAEPLFKVGDFLKNKEDGKQILIVAIVGDQYKYDGGDEIHKYEFFECIEAQYEKVRSKDDIARNAASGWCRCFKCDGIVNQTHEKCDKAKLMTCLQWYHGYRTALLALGELFDTFNSLKDQ